MEAIQNFYSKYRAGEISRESLEQMVGIVKGFTFVGVSDTEMTVLHNGESKNIK